MKQARWSIQAQPTRPNGCCRGGFTLLELLAVIAIIGLLAALLLPVLSKAGNRARRVDCANRMGQWAKAMILYADDNQDIIPREGYEPFGDTYLNLWIQVKGRPLADGRRESDDIWYNALPPYLSVPMARAYSADADKPSFYCSGTMFHCPSARFPAVTGKTEEQYYAFFSVAMNSQLISAPDDIPTISFNRLGRHSSRIVLFAENRLEGEPKVHVNQDNTHLGQPATYARRFVPRHERGGNLAFADAHVRWFPGDRVVETRGINAGGPIDPPSEIVWGPD